MCHPGRPGPQGLSQAGSPGWAPFHRVKSMGCSLRLSTSTLAPAIIPSKVRAAQFAVSLAAGHPEEHVGVHLVCVALVHQVRYGAGDGADLFGGPGIHVGPLHVQSVHGPEELFDIPIGQFVDGYILLLGPLDQLVVHVGEVLDVTHQVAPKLQVAPQHVERHVAQGVAHVGGGVGRHSANVHLDARRVGGGERLGLAGQGVVKLHISATIDATA